MVTDSILSCRSLTREYTRGGGGFLDRFRSREYPTVRALDGVSLDVAAGEVVGLAGPSGSGKSTLLHLLAGLDAPTDGSIHLGGTDVGALSGRGRTRLRRDRVGIVFQRFYLLPSLSARGNVALPLVEQGLSKRQRRERATSLLQAVGLGDRIDHAPDELSGGEQQRVAIAYPAAAVLNHVVAAIVGFEGLVRTPPRVVVGGAALGIVATGLAALAISVLIHRAATPTKTLR